MISVHHIDQSEIESKILADRALPLRATFVRVVYQCPVTYECSIGFEVKWTDGKISKSVEVSPGEVRRAAREVLGYTWPDRVDNVWRGGGDSLRVKVRPFWPSSKTRGS